jgi:hypothetical protein
VTSSRQGKCITAQRQEDRSLCGAARLRHGGTLVARDFVGIKSISVLLFGDFTKRNLLA